MVLKINIGSAVREKHGNAAFMPHTAVTRAAARARTWRARFHETTCFSGIDLSDELANEIATQKPDALILDFGPLGDDPSKTLEVLRAVKSAVSGIPVLIVAKRHSLSLQEGMMELGIEAVPLKPDTHPSHLSGLLRHISNHAEEQDSDVYVIEDELYDPEP
jgi:DNA-binding NarL/FixJ family response regulator